MEEYIEDPITDFKVRMGCRSLNGLFFRAAWTDSFPLY